MGQLRLVRFQTNFAPDKLAVPLAAERLKLRRSGGMRHRTIFDEGLFLVSFSVALGVLAFIIPAHGASTRDVQTAGPGNEYVDLCDTGSAPSDCVAAVRLTDDQRPAYQRHSADR